MQRWTVDVSGRLDAFLAEDGRVSSRAKAKAAVEAGAVAVNGETVRKASLRLRAGDEVALDEVPATPGAGRIAPADLRLPVLYEDAACLVVHKPAGIAVHPGAGMAEGEETILHGAAHLLAGAGLPFSPQAVLVHRLDKDTTGCLLLAKSPEAHRSLQAQFEARTVSKTYLAVVAGVPSPPSALIDAPIGRSTADRTKMSVVGGGKRRGATTTYRMLAHSRDAALIACDLHTGRTHQIRVHLSSIGHPVLGDDAYASSLSARVADAHGIRSLCLHARRLAFVSPADGKEHVVEAPVPPSFTEAIAKAGIAWDGSAV